MRSSVIAASVTATLMAMPIAVAADTGGAAATQKDSVEGALPTVIGFAFVDSSVTGQGSRAQLPPDAKLYPSGATVTGSEGCPTTRYRTDGLIVAVIDYEGRPTAGSVTVTRRPATGGSFDNAPYYLDLNSGRTLQYLGPHFDNGVYDVRLEYDLAQGKPKSATASLELSRQCPPVN